MLAISWMISATATLHLGIIRVGALVVVTVTTRAMTALVRPPILSEPPAEVEVALLVSVKDRRRPVGARLDWLVAPGHAF